MKLEDVDIQKLLPLFMREDEACMGFSAALNGLLAEVAAKIQLLSRWDHIDEMTDAQLDELAWELNITWYNKTAPLEVKRQVVRESELVHSKLGTKWAVETLLGTYYGDVTVQEWWEYGGEPNHFKILSPNPSILNDEAAFMFYLNAAKRLSSWLDEVKMTGFILDAHAGAAQAHNYAYFNFDQNMTWAEWGLANKTWEELDARHRTARDYFKRGE